MENKQCLVSRLRSVLLSESMREFKRGDIAHMLMEENLPMTQSKKLGG